MVSVSLPFLGVTPKVFDRTWQPSNITAWQCSPCTIRLAKWVRAYKG